MGKNVIISVRGAQTAETEEINETELVTEGKFYKKGDAYYVMYKETEMTGMEGTTTTLKIGNGKITLMRFGTTNSQLIFEQGKKHVSHYDTLYGSFTVGVYTHEVNIDVNDCGGEISVDYRIEIDNFRTGENDFHMRIREAGKPGDIRGDAGEETDKSCYC